MKIDQQTWDQPRKRHYKDKRKYRPTKKHLLDRLQSAEKSYIFWRSHVEHNERKKGGDYAFWDETCRKYAEEYADKILDLRAEIEKMSAKRERE